MKQLVRLAGVATITLLGATSAAGDNAQPEAKWCLQRAVDESQNLVIILANLGYKNFPRKADYPWLLQVNITTVHQNRNGHPTDDEAAAMNLVEDGLTAALRKAVAIQFIGRATVKGSRELVYFVNDAAKANALLTQLAKKPQVRRWEFSIAKDLQWKHAEDLIGGDPECL